MTSYQTKETSKLHSELFPRDLTSVESHKRMRLRVNRVAIIQELQVEHILRYLVERSIINENDKKIIEKGTTSQDRARILLDILPEKGKENDWYKNFRDSLKNAQAGKETKKKYQILVEFLDNTIINYQPKIGNMGQTTQEQEFTKFPRYEPLPKIPSGNSLSSVANSSHTYTIEQPDEPPRYTETDSSTDPQTKPKPSLTLIKGFYHKWIPTPDNFTSLIEEPSEHFQMLKDSNDPNDKEQLEKELEALKKMQDLEILFVMDRRGRLPEGFEISLFKATTDILLDPDSYHLYLKYFLQFKNNHYLDMASEIAASFTGFIYSIGNSKDNETREYVVKVAFGLFDFLKEFGYFYRACSVLEALIVYLETYPDITTWMAVWQAYVKLMEIYNTNYQFKDTDWAYNEVQQVTRRIKLMSFGQDLLDECDMYVELSRLLREQGSEVPSYGWAQKSMQEVEPNNKYGIINVLCNATLAYAAMFNLKRAQQLAVHAVKQAKQFFGVRHPTYVKALFHYCNFATEFKQDFMAVEVAQHALSVAEKIYGCQSMYVAHAHRTVAVAMMVTKDFDGDQYYDHAWKALQTAQDLVHGSHPLLAIFRYTLAQCLYWKASREDSNESRFTLTWAQAECNTALRIFKVNSGMYSLKTAQALTLMGQIYTKLGRLEEAENYLQESLTLHTLSMSPKSNYTLMIKSMLATFYKMIERPLEAIDLFRDVVECVDTGGVYMSWVHNSFDNIISLLKATNNHQQADKYQAQLIDWMRRNPPDDNPITWDELQSVPPPYETFLSDFNIWAKRINKAKIGLKKLAIM